MIQIENHINSSENDLFEENEDEIIASEYREAGINTVRGNSTSNVGGLTGGHRQGCIYYKHTSSHNNERIPNSSKSLSASIGGIGKKAEKNDVKISPEKRSLFSMNNNNSSNN